MSDAASIRDIFKLIYIASSLNISAQQYEHSVIWRLTSAFSQIVSCDSRHRSAPCAVSQGSRAPLQRITLCIEIL